ncbi:MAG: chemotaxis protein CheR [Proteobacteria bacterium]|nr:chemotaxis protein CheR [Pseudomonadota bacterium]
MEQDDLLLDRFSRDNLSLKDFRKLSDFIGAKIGIKMSDVKKGMVESRLRKRLRLLQIETYKEYCDYLFSQEGMTEELNEFINVITTNKTDFFREPEHFTFLLNKALPELVASFQAGIIRKFYVWSSACSRGDEPYTIAMVLKEFSRSQPDFKFSILATDISTKVLSIGEQGIYTSGEIEPIPVELRKKYLLRSKDKKKEIFRIVPELRSAIKFYRMNLTGGDYRIREMMDVIFCRNVIIYFSKETQDRLLLRLCNQLRPGGYLFMGHSELLDCRKLPLFSVAPTIYKKRK